MGSRCQGEDEATAASSRGDGRCPFASPRRRKEPAWHRRQRRQRQQARLLLAAVQAAGRLAGHHSWPRRRDAAVPPEGAAIAGPPSLAFHTQRPIDDLVCFHAVPLRRSELRYAVADLATAQTEQDDLQQFHDAPWIPTDTSYTDLPGFSAMVEAREKLDTRGIADHETDGPPTVEAAAASEPPDGVAPASVVMPVMPQRHWTLLEHPQLRELGATVEDLAAVLDAAQEGDPAFRVGRTYAHLVNLPGGHVIHHMVLNEIREDLANFGWTSQDIDELAVAVFELVDPTEGAAMIHALGISTGVAVKPPRPSKRSRKPGR